MPCTLPLEDLWAGLREAHANNVAAFPVDGPFEVLTTESGQVQGGVLHPDLAEATRLALSIPREAIRARSQDFIWAKASQLFVSYVRKISV
jgi:hypothetical protein